MQHAAVPTPESVSELDAFKMNYHVSRNGLQHHGKPEAVSRRPTRHIFELSYLKILVAAITHVNALVWH